MIALGMESKAAGKLGPIDGGHVHEPEPGPNTGDVRCRTCGVPLRRYDMDVKRGYGGIAAAVEGVVSKKVEGGMAVPDIEPKKNRRERRAEKSKARRRG